ncbi:hypothetical protein FRC11_009848 [Ceratobasidium sp. 423]|nr:hypothetical protein FRC11_009848 [Ceratobasidium sp. 423]
MSSAVWLYGPPRSQLFTIPAEYKICLHENHRVASDVLCYRVNIAEAYSAEDDYEAPVVIFAKGGLQYHEHRMTVSLAEPIGELDRYQGIQFSHAVYTTERPTPWPVEEDAWRFRQVIMHDTHPLLSYWPREPITSGSWRAPFISGWLPKTYTAEDGTRVSWHELQSRDEEERDRWGVDATVTAGAVALYGIPKAHITDTDYLGSICIRIDTGPCEIVDIKHAYLNVEHHHEAVLLWRHDALDPGRKTHIAVRLTGAGNQRMTVFPFKEFRYFEKQEYSRGSSGSEVYVYGAPKSLIKGSFASQHVCINDVCHLIDTEQAYLNAPGGPIDSAASNITSESLSPELEPVLLWSQTGLDDQLQHTLRLALAPLHSEDNAEMTIAKITYAKALGKSRPDTPVPAPDESFEGPLFPPHSEKWAPRPPPPPPKPKPEPEPEPKPEPKPKPKPKPKPEPEPSTSQPDPTPPPTTTPPQSEHPTEPPTRPTPPPSHPHPSPPPVPEPEPPMLPDFIGWPLCLLGLSAIIVMKRRADRRRELQALLGDGLLRVDADGDGRYRDPRTGDDRSTIYGGASNYGGTSSGGGGATNHRGTTNYGGSSIHGGTTNPGYTTQNYGPPPSYTQPPSYHAGRSVLSGTSTNLPSYSDVAREQRLRALRTAAFVAQQRTRR